MLLKCEFCGQVFVDNDALTDMINDPDVFDIHGIMNSGCCTTCADEDHNLWNLPEPILDQMLKVQREHPAD